MKEKPEKIKVQYAYLPELLLPWYQVNKRELPWRQDQVPYHVWLSEIMLQQTRVEAVRVYYTRFLQALPTIADLADVSEERLLKLWEGLGYYSRARNLKKAAQQIMQQHGGVFPSDYAEILSLPGVGPYTAGAIASICFAQPTPAVDGNVLRVISRVTGDKTPIDSSPLKKEITQQLAEVYPPGASDTFTQALMELGALICIPNGAPKCKQCPIAEICTANKENRQAELPVKPQKKKRKQQDLTVFVLQCGGKIALTKRGEHGVLSGMWELPNVAGTLTEAHAIQQAEAWGTAPQQLIRRTKRKHIFTHIEWDMCCYVIACAYCATPFHWIAQDRIAKELAIPTAFRRILEDD